jgi:hypothetical protein
MQYVRNINNLWLFRILATALLAPLLLLLSCCAFLVDKPSTSSTMSNSAIENHTVTIEIASIPPGCIVELNGEFLGLTPFRLTVDSDSEGRWSRWDAHVYVLTCTAPTGQFDSRRWLCATKIPSAILFRPMGWSYESLVPKATGIPHIWKAKGEPPGGS